MKRIGHKGADLIAPGNTIASFDAALTAGVDMIEFDVLSAQRDGTGELYLAHDYNHIDGALTFEQGLDHLCTAGYAGLEFDVDLKLPGYEQRVVEALHERGLAERALISTMETQSLRRLRQIAPDIRIGRSVPKARRDYRSRRGTRLLAGAGLACLRRTLPSRMATELRRGEIDAVMALAAVVTPRLVAAVHGAGGEIYAWTVDDGERIAELGRLGVDGVITNDPRLFATA